MADTASLIELVTSVDVGSISPVFLQIQNFYTTIFNGVGGSISAFTNIFAGADSIVQSGLLALSES